MDYGGDILAGIRRRGVTRERRELELPTGRETFLRWLVDQVRATSRPPMRVVEWGYGVSSVTEERAAGSEVIGFECDPIRVLETLYPAMSYERQPELVFEVEVEEARADRTRVQISCYLPGPFSDMVRNLIMRSIQAFEPSELYPRRPLPPAKPNTTRRDDWFRYYHAMQHAGQHYTLRRLAEEMHLSYGYVRNLHSDWMAEHSQDVTLSDRSADAF